jgi:hypothetical protein
MSSGNALQQRKSAAETGDSMRRVGIWEIPRGICFGKTCHVSMANGSAMPKVPCYAALYGNGGDSCSQGLAC